MLMENFMFENTIIKFYDNDIVKDIDTQKDYINKIIIKLINKSNSL